MTRVKKESSDFGPGTGSAPRHLSPAKYILTFIAVALIMMAGVALYYYSETQKALRLQAKELASVARIKAGQIVHWREKHLVDEIQRVVSDPFFIERVGAFLRNPDRPDQLELLVDIQTYLELEAKQDFFQAILMTTGGRVLFSYPEIEGSPSPVTIDLAAEALLKGGAAVSKIYPDDKGRILIDVAGVIRDREKRALAVLIKRIDAGLHLFPLLRQWPVPSKSAEVMLVRRSNDSVLFLNRPLLDSRTGFFSRPLTRADLPSAAAVLGKRGTFKGIDYRGKKVLAFIAPVENTPWLLVAKMDESEIIADVYYHQKVIMIFAGLLLVLSAFGIGEIYRNRRLYKSGLETREELKRSDIKIRRIIERSADGIVVLNADGLVVFANPSAVQLFGTSYEKMLGRPLDLPRADSGFVDSAEIVRPDGSSRIVSIRTVSSGLVEEWRSFVFLRDITVERVAEKRQENQRRILISLIRGEGLASVLEMIAVSMEQEDRQCVCSIMLVESTGKYLFMAAAPSLPDSFKSAMDGLPVGEGVSPCSTSVFQGKAVVAEDILTHPYWTGFSEEAQKAGLRSCFCEPLFSGAGRVIGVFAVYYRKPKAPGPKELDIIRSNASFAALAVEHAQAKESLVRVNRALSILGALNEVILNAKSVQQLLDEACRAAVEKGGLSLAWIGAVADDKRHVVPLARFGRDEGYVDSVKVVLDDDITGKGPTGTSLLTGNTSTVSFISKDADYLPWRKEAIKRGFRSSASVPFELDGKKAALCIYSSDENSFDKEVLALLESFVQNVGQAAKALRISGELEAYQERLEEMVEQRTRELEAAMVAAEEASSAKSRFLSNMSHEIRTPLNAILGFSEILMEEGHALTPHQSERLKAIHGSAEHLLALINDILDMSRIEEGRVEPALERFGLRAMLDEVIMIFKSRAEARGLWFRADIDKALPAFVLGDEMKLRQILVNLIGNAVKFTEKGGVTVRFYVAEERNGDISKDLFLFAAEIEDTGAGIPGDMREAVFEKFAQTDYGARKGGTGLGLAISRNLARLMGGDITLEARQGRGSVFKLETRLKALPGAEVARKRIHGIPAGIKGKRSPVKILVADDIKSNRELLVSILSPVGFDLLEAENGKEAVEIFQEHLPDAVLMDIRMPVMDGLEAIRRIKATPVGLKTPVIAVTASAFADAEKEILSRGADFYLRKPVRIREVFDILAECLGLEFVYKEPSAEPPRISLSGKLAKRIRRVVEQGDISTLKSLIEDLEGIDAQTARELKILADRYDYEAILAILD